MNKEKLQFIDLFNDRLEKDDFENLCFSEKEIKDYENWQWDPFIVFEGDPDYMIDESWNTIYFIRIDNKVYYIDYDSNWDQGYSDLKKLEQFIENQSMKISLWWNSSRSETENRKYFEDENYSWDWFNSYNWLKIAYRNGCWYSYTLFKYID